MKPSLEGCSTNAKEAPSLSEVKIDAAGLYRSISMSWGVKPNISFLLKFYQIYVWYKSYTID